MTSVSLLRDLLLNKQRCLPQSIISKVQRVLLPKKDCEQRLVKKDAFRAPKCALNLLCSCIILYKWGWIAGHRQDAAVFFFLLFPYPSNCRLRREVPALRGNGGGGGGRRVAQVGSQAADRKAEKQTITRLCRTEEA